MDFLITFDESVIGVDLGDFIIDSSPTVSGNITALTGSNESYTLTVSGILGDGVLSVALQASGTGITD
ncbi:MAG: hypothetical protein ABGY96_28080, partial [bacterium]